VHQGRGFGVYVNPIPIPSAFRRFGCGLLGLVSTVARMKRSEIRGDAPGLRFTPSGLRLWNCSAGVQQVPPDLQYLILAGIRTTGLKKQDIPGGRLTQT